MVRNALAIGVAVASLMASVGLNQANAAGVYQAPPKCSNPTGTPGSKQAYVYDMLNYGLDNKGNYIITCNCYVLDYSASGSKDDWSAWDASYKFPNDKIISVKVGSGARLTLFWNSFYTKDNGAPKVLSQGTPYATLGSWNGKASAARIVNANQAVDCSTTRTDLTILWTDPYFGGDCVALNYLSTGAKYNNAVGMGFRNDTASSAWNTTSDSNYERLQRDSGANSTPINVLLTLQTWGQNPEEYPNLASAWNGTTYVNVNDMVSGVTVYGDVIFP